MLTDSLSNKNIICNLPQSCTGSLLHHRISHLDKNILVSTCLALITCKCTSQFRDCRFSWSLSAGFACCMSGWYQHLLNMWVAWCKNSQLLPYLRRLCHTSTQKAAKFPLPASSAQLTHGHSIQDTNLLPDVKVGCIWLTVLSWSTVIGMQPSKESYITVHPV